MNADNVVRVLLERADRAKAAAVRHEVDALRAEQERDRESELARQDHATYDEFRQAAEQLKPGCVAEWDTQVAQAESANLGFQSAQFVPPGVGVRL